MRAIVYTTYGPPDVLELKELEKPIPRDNEVLIRVHATSVTNADCFMRRAETLMGRAFLGLWRPKRKILGSEIAGEIEAIGKNVKRFRKGDQVYGFTGFRLGAYAEYSCMPEKGSLVIKPDIATHEEAASLVDGVSTAYYFFKAKGNIQRGQKCLINGASGSVGSSAVQLAKYFGAEVTAVCSAANSEFVRSLGADHIIDYTKEDFAKNRETYDIIFDTVGKSSFSRCKGSLRKKGCYLTTVGSPFRYLQMFWTSFLGGRRIMCGMSIDKIEALELMNSLIVTGDLRPVVDRCYPLEEMAEAHRYVEKGHKRGNVVIKVAGDP